MKKIFALALFGTPALLSFGQYAGGVGDGQDQGLNYQSNLQGQIWGVKSLFQGGQGDGQDRSQQSGYLDGGPAIQAYGGGQGDGQDYALVQSTMSGQEITHLYLGGQGDGQDVFSLQAYLDNTSPKVMYTGGEGDGQDQDRLAGYLNGLPSSVYFSGGNGDGHDQAFTQTAMSGDMLTVLYGGGGGDGHDVNQFNGVVPFPVTLLSFDAFPEQDFVLVQWVTEREENSAFFTVEKTQDGNLFEQVAEVPAAGFSESILPYEAKDAHPFPGQSFYRLKMTDLDGAFNYSQLKEVNFSNNVRWDFTLFPNPNAGQRMNIDLRGLQAGDHLVVQVIDMSGKQVYEGEIHLNYTGALTHPIELANELAEGSYVVRVTNDNQGQASKLLLVR